MADPRRLENLRARVARDDLGNLASPLRVEVYGVLDSRGRPTAFAELSLADAASLATEVTEALATCLTIRGEG